MRSSVVNQDVRSAVRNTGEVSIAVGTSVTSASLRHDLEKRFVSFACTRLRFHAGERRRNDYYLDVSVPLGSVIKQ